MRAQQFRLAFGGFEQLREAVVILANSQFSKGINEFFGISRCLFGRYAPRQWDLLAGVRVAQEFLPDQFLIHLLA
jgi:hypothetical protein